MTPCSVVAVGTSGSLEDEAPCGLGCHWTWRALWTRASLDAARVLLRAVSRSVRVNGTEEGDNGAWRSLESFSAGTVECTSERRESLRNSTRLARTGVVWLPRNSREPLVSGS